MTTSVSLTVKREQLQVWYISQGVGPVSLVVTDAHHVRHSCGDGLNLVKEDVPLQGVSMFIFMHVYLSIIN